MAGVARWDISDESLMGPLRGRLLGGMLISGGLIWAVTGLTQMHTLAGPVARVALPGLVISGVAVLWRARRMGAREYSGWLMLSQIFCAAYESIMVSVMPHVPLEMALIGYLMMAAAFCPSRIDVALQSLVGVAGMVFVALARLGQIPDLANVLGTEIPILLLPVFVVRVLWELAYASLLAAKAGELTDPLTGLANRRALERHGRACWSERAATGEPLTFLVLDIDHFKQVNDTLGHAAGDELIRRTSELLVANLRPGDLAVRLGGEEFLLVTRAGLREGALVAERLRALIERELQPVTVSIGVCEAHPEPGDSLPVDLWRAVDVADQALYQAKRSGRNRVVSDAGQ